MQVLVYEEIYIPLRLADWSIDLFFFFFDFLG